MKMIRGIIEFSVFAVCILLTACTVDKAPAPIEVTSDQVTTEAKENLSVSSPFEIFCDFRCPFCARFFTTLFAGAKYEGKEPIYVFKHLPFPFHPGSETLARFYEAAMLNHSAERDELIESLYRFRGQSDIQQLILALSITHGFDLQQIMRDMEARDVAFTVSESKQAAANRDVDHTPALFYLGKEVTLNEPEELARFVIERSPSRNSNIHSTIGAGCSSCEDTRSSK